MINISINLTENQERLLKENNINLVEDFRQFLIEKLETIENSKKYNKAYQEHLKNPKTYTDEEFMALMGLDD